MKDHHQYLCASMYAVIEECPDGPPTIKEVRQAFKTTIANLREAGFFGRPSSALPADLEMGDVVTVEHRTAGQVIGRFVAPARRGGFAKILDTKTGRIVSGRFAAVER